MHPIATRKFWAANVVVWSLVALLYAGRSLAEPADTADLRATFVTWFECCYVWAILTAPIFVLCARLASDPGRQVRDLAVHTVCAAGCCLIAITIDTATWQSVDRHATGVFGADWLTDARNTLPWNLLNYIYIVLAWHTLDRTSRIRRARLHAAELETSLRRAELDALRMQIQPHFLFNTLNTIDVMMEEDAGAARAVLGELVRILRAVLLPTHAQTWPLTSELRLLRSYLTIEQARFGDRLRVSFDTGGDVGDCIVPALLLQPLVENAVRHGIGPRIGGGEIRIVAARVGDMLRLTVADDGPGLAPGHASGIGIANTRARLKLLYGSAHRFDLSTRPGGGVAVDMTLPVEQTHSQAVQAAPT